MLQISPSHVPGPDSPPADDDVPSIPDVIVHLHPPSPPPRHRLPGERGGLVHRFSIVGWEGYLRCGVYQDGSLGEIFIKMSKTGSNISGLMDSFATAISIALQHGVPLEDLAAKFIGARFEPFGLTQNPEIRTTTSIIDYVFRFLLMRFSHAPSTPAT